MLKKNTRPTFLQRHPPKHIGIDKIQSDKKVKTKILILQQFRCLICLQGMYTYKNYYSQHNVIEMYVIFYYASTTFAITTDKWRARMLCSRYLFSSCNALILDIDPLKDVIYRKIQEISCSRASAEIRLWHYGSFILLYVSRQQRVYVPSTH